MQAKILLADDDLSIISYLEPMLKRALFHVVVAQDGEQALALTESEAPDLIILDIKMPKLDGWEVCRQLRKRERYIPIIMLTSVFTEVIDEVIGLKIGADHYFPKDTDPHILIAQIEATLRIVYASRATSHSNLLTCADLKIDLDKRKVWMAGRKIDLTPKEFQL